MKKLCFTTFVYDWYQDYIPIYILSILTAFPQHYVKIFVEEPLLDKNKNNLDLLRQNQITSFEVIDSFQDHKEWCKLPHKAAYRFLLTREYFEGFDYVYFGDVDFINYNEHNDQFYDIYENHCDQTGLPFSNELNYDYGKFRITGLHFIIKDNYFNAVDPIIQDIKSGNNEFTKHCIHSVRWPSYDEEMLFYMLFHTFDLRSLIGYRRPFHGVHIGTFRILGNQDSFVENKIQISDGRNCLPQWKNDIDKIRKITESTLFNVFYNEMCPQAKNTVAKMHSVLNGKLFL